MTARDTVFEPLHGKGRPAGEALALLVERWTATPLGDADVAALEGALHHLLRRAQLRRELLPSADPVQLARELVVALKAGQGSEAVGRLPLTRSER